MKFKDLEEGKDYTRDGYTGKFRKREGLLQTYDDKHNVWCWAMSTFNRVSSMEFEPYIGPCYAHEAFEHMRDGGTCEIYGVRYRLDRGILVERDILDEGGTWEDAPMTYEMLKEEIWVKL